LTGRQSLIEFWKEKERKKMKFGYETWHTMKFGNTTATFKVYPSGSFVIQTILRDGKNVTDSLLANRSVSGLIRFNVANNLIKY
jgi:hypothetical protein